MSIPQYELHLYAQSLSIKQGIENNVSNDSLNIEKIMHEIPSQWGEVRKYWFSNDWSPDKPFVIHIQDAHAQPDAQRSISGILDYLSSNFPKLNIGIEGTDGTLHAEYFDIFPQYPELNESIVNDLLEKGELTGLELFLWERYKKKKIRSAQNNIEVYGIEDSSAYIANFNSYRKTLLTKGDTSKSLEVLRKDLHKKASIILKKELLEFLTEREKRRKGVFGNGKKTLPNFSVYAEYLQDLYFKKIGKDLVEDDYQLKYPNLVRIFHIQNLEKSYSKEKIKSDWTEIIKIFKSDENLELVGNHIEEIELLGMELGYVELKPSDLTVKRNFRNAPRFLLEEIVRRLREPEDLFNRHKAFLSSYQQIVFQSELDARDLMREFDEVERALLKEMISSPKELEMVQDLRAYEYLEKLLFLEVSSEEYGNIQNHESAFESFFKNYPVLSEHFKQAKSFYNGVLKRDHFLVDNLLRKSKGNHHILISGGFHSKAIEKLLEKKNISYFVLSPRIGKLADSSLYHRVMTGSHADMSEYFGVQNPFQTEQEGLFYSALFSAFAQKGKDYQTQESMMGILEGIRQHPIFLRSFQAPAISSTVLKEPVSVRDPQIGRHDHQLPEMVLPQTKLPHLVPLVNVFHALALQSEERSQIRQEYEEAVKLDQIDAMVLKLRRLLGAEGFELPLESFSKNVFQSMSARHIQEVPIERLLKEFLIIHILWGEYFRTSQSSKSIEESPYFIATYQPEDIEHTEIFNVGWNQEKLMGEMFEAIRFDQDGVNVHTWGERIDDESSFGFSVIEVSEKGKRWSEEALSDFKSRYSTERIVGGRSVYMIDTTKIFKKLDLEIQRVLLELEEEFPQFKEIAIPKSVGVHQAVIAKHDPYPSPSDLAIRNPFDKDHLILKSIFTEYDDPSRREAKVAFYMSILNDTVSSEAETFKKMDKLTQEAVDGIFLDAVAKEQEGVNPIYYLIHELYELWERSESKEKDLIYQFAMGVTRFTREREENLSEEEVEGEIQKAEKIGDMIYAGIRYQYFNLTSNERDWFMKDIVLKDWSNINEKRINSQETRKGLKETKQKLYVYYLKRIFELEEAYQNAQKEIEEINIRIRDLEERKSQGEDLQSELNKAEASLKKHEGFMEVYVMGVMFFRMSFDSEFNRYDLRVSTAEKKAFFDAIKKLKAIEESGKGFPLTKDDGETENALFVSGVGAKFLKAVEKNREKLSRRPVSTFDAYRILKGVIYRFIEKIAEKTKWRWVSVLLFFFKSYYVSNYVVENITRFTKYYKLVRGIRAGSAKSDEIDRVVLLMAHIIENNAILKLSDEEQRNTLYVADEVKQSDFFELLDRNPLLKGMISKTGSTGSHWLAMLLGMLQKGRDRELLILPGVQDADEIRPGDHLFIDGAEEVFIVNPQLSPRLSDLIEHRVDEDESLKRITQHFVEDKIETGLASTSSDDFSMTVFTEIFRLEDAETSMKDFGSDGIGLYRSEYDYMDEHELGEEATYQARLKAADSIQGVLTERGLDMSVDKLQEMKPIRDDVQTEIKSRMINGRLKEVREPQYVGTSFYMHDPVGSRIIRKQLRAALRVFHDGKNKNYRFLFPMVENEEEAQFLKNLIEEVKMDLVQNLGLNRKILDQMSFGAMIETVEAAEKTEAILNAGEFDFVSIGTNDMARSAFNPDLHRDDIALSEAYGEMSPEFIQAIDQTLSGVSRKNASLRSEGSQKRITTCYCGQYGSTQNFLIAAYGLAGKYPDLIDKDKSKILISPTANSYLLGNVLMALSYLSFEKVASLTELLVEEKFEEAAKFVKEFQASMKSDISASLGPSQRVSLLLGLEDIKSENRSEFQEEFGFTSSVTTDPVSEPIVSDRGRRYQGPLYVQDDGARLLPLFDREELTVAGVVGSLGIQNSILREKLLSQSAAYLEKSLERGLTTEQSLIELSEWVMKLNERLYILKEKVIRFEKVRKGSDGIDPEEGKFDLYVTYRALGGDGIEESKAIPFIDLLKYLPPSETLLLGNRLAEEEPGYFYDLLALGLLNKRIGFENEAQTRSKENFFESWDAEDFVRRLAFYNERTSRDKVGGVLAALRYMLKSKVLPRQIYDVLLSAQYEMKRLHDMGEAEFRTEVRNYLELWKRAYGTGENQLGIRMMIKELESAENYIGRVFGDTRGTDWSPARTSYRRGGQFDTIVDIIGKLFFMDRLFRYDIHQQMLTDAAMDLVSSSETRTEMELPSALDVWDEGAGIFKSIRNVRNNAAENVLQKTLGLKEPAQKRSSDDPIRLQAKLESSSSKRLIYKRHGWFKRLAVGGLFFVFSTFFVAGETVEGIMARLKADPNGDGLLERIQVYEDVIQSRTQAQNAELLSDALVEVIDAVFPKKGPEFKKELFNDLMVIFFIESGGLNYTVQNGSDGDDIKMAMGLSQTEVWGSMTMGDHILNYLGYRSKRDGEVHDNAQRLLAELMDLGDQDEIPRLKKAVEKLTSENKKETTLKTGQAIAWYLPDMKMDALLATLKIYRSVLHKIDADEYQKLSIAEVYRRYRGAPTKDDRVNRWKEGEAKPFLIPASQKWSLFRESLKAQKEAVAQLDISTPAPPKAPEPIGLVPIQKVPVESQADTTVLESERIVEEPLLEESLAVAEEVIIQPRSFMSEILAILGMIFTLRFLPSLFRAGRIVLSWMNPMIPTRSIAGEIFKRVFLVGVMALVSFTTLQTFLWVLESSGGIAYLILSVSLTTAGFILYGSYRRIVHIPSKQLLPEKSESRFVNIAAFMTSVETGSPIIIRNRNLTFEWGLYLKDLRRKVQSARNEEELRSVMLKDLMGPYRDMMNSLLAQEDAVQAEPMALLFGKGAYQQVVNNKLQVINSGLFDLDPEEANSEHIYRAGRDLVLISYIAGILSLGSRERKFIQNMFYESVDEINITANRRRPIGVNEKQFYYLRLFDSLRPVMNYVNKLLYYGRLGKSYLSEDDILDFLNWVFAVQRDFKSRVEDGFEESGRLEVNHLYKALEHFQIYNLDQERNQESLNQGIQALAQFFHQFIIVYFDSTEKNGNDPIWSEWEKEVDFVLHALMGRRFDGRDLSEWKYDRSTMAGSVDSDASHKIQPEVYISELEDLYGGEGFSFAAPIRALVYYLFTQEIIEGFILSEKYVDLDVDRDLLDFDEVDRLPNGTRVIKIEEDSEGIYQNIPLINFFNPGSSFARNLLATGIGSLESVSVIVRYVKGGVPEAIAFIDESKEDLTVVVPLLKGVTDETFSQKILTKLISQRPGARMAIQEKDAALFRLSIQFEEIGSGPYEGEYRAQLHFTDFSTKVMARFFIDSFMSEERWQKEFIGDPRSDSLLGLNITGDIPWGWLNQIMGFISRKKIRIDFVNRYVKSTNKVVDEISNLVKLLETSTYMWTNKRSQVHEASIPEALRGLEFSLRFKESFIELTEQSREGNLMSMEFVPRTDDIASYLREEHPQREQFIQLLRNEIAKVYMAHLLKTHKRSEMRSPEDGLRLSVESVVLTGRSFLKSTLHIPSILERGLDLGIVKKAWAESSEQRIEISDPQILEWSQDFVQDIGPSVHFNLSKIPVDKFEEFLDELMPTLVIATRMNAKLNFNFNWPDMNELDLKEKLLQRAEEDGVYLNPRNIRIRVSKEVFATISALSEVETVNALASFDSIDLNGYGERGGSRWVLNETKINDLSVISRQMAVVLWLSVGDSERTFEPKKPEDYEFYEELGGKFESFHSIMASA